jgi:hypothetical protein
MFHVLQTIPTSEIVSTHQYWLFLMVKLGITIVLAPTPSLPATTDAVDSALVRGTSRADRRQGYVIPLGTDGPGTWTCLE